MRKIAYGLTGAALLIGVAYAATNQYGSDTGTIQVVEGKDASGPSASSPTPIVSASSDEASAVTATNVSVERMPRDADASNQAGWWVPLAVKNGNTYFAFTAPGPDDDKHYTKVGRRDSYGNWTFGILSERDGTVVAHTDDYGHRQPTIAIDGKGYIHVWTDLHNGDWEYYRSANPYDATDIRRSSLMPGSGLFTYPVAKTDADGNVWLIIRNRTGSDGNGELYRWSNTDRTWAKVAAFASQNDAVVYPDDIDFGSDGSVNLLWEWAKSEPRTLRHYGSFLRYYPSSGKWFYVDGTPAQIPVGLGNSRLFYLPLQSGEAFTTTQTTMGLQTAKLAINPADGRPTIAYRFRPTDGSGDNNFDVWRVRWAGGAWVDRERIYQANNDTYAAVGLTRNANNVRVYFATTAGAQRAVKTPDTDWTIAALPRGAKVQRINATPLNSTSDIVYAAAPTDVSSQVGSVYWMKADD